MSAAMSTNLRVINTNEKYRRLLDKYWELKGRGLGENEIRIKLGMTPVQFHALKHREFTEGIHTWTEDEEEMLFELFLAHGTRWDQIKCEMKEKLGVNVTAVQVKNKLYAMKKKRRYARRFQEEAVLDIRRGRRPKYEVGCKRSRRRKSPRTCVPESKEEARADELDIVALMASMDVSVQPEEVTVLPPPQPPQSPPQPRALEQTATESTVLNMELEGELGAVAVTPFSVEELVDCVPGLLGHSLGLYEDALETPGRFSLMTL